MDDNDDKQVDIDTEKLRESVKQVIPATIEKKLTPTQKDKCRNIVKTINEYGVNQREKLYLCELLALELEDRELMVLFSDAVKKCRTKLGESEKELVLPKKKLIL